MDAFGVRQWIATRRAAPSSPTPPPPAAGLRVEITQRVRFEAAHCLPDMTGDQAITHGHSWQADVVVSGAEPSGFLDPRRLAQHFRMHLAPLLDHADLNKTLPEDCQPPSAGNLALYIAGSYLDHGYNVIRVVVYESDAAATIIA